ncbi:proline dehydrogenase family protein [Subtercola frigoramans]|uniref:L-glutamate gamma-semialdehyde dehydrogenase n=1 Tax=Subtercola frigoramans TaxID=120298 RepID=A0ABS2L7C7_9MICO|nr:proline dehydrogenase family protein [Subtercola frigoramans]MBM7473003.1 RHH-type proline utilization regulon transcriptional repressor/proline dehydrogenase/delta 1-pyrroline-5-carboxylate dehydrogenase [Subtercola frigoramans]
MTDILQSEHDPRTAGSTASPDERPNDGLRAEALALTGDVVALVRRWLAASSTVPVDASAAQLAGVLKDPNGLAFTVGFVDGVVRPEDLGVAARNLRALAPRVPAFLPWYLRAAVRVGGTLAPALPRLVVPASRAVLRRMVGHLIIDATPSKLGRAIAKIRSRGVKLNVNLLGEAVLGSHEAERRLAGTRALLARDDVDYVSIKVSSTVAPHSPWAFAEAVEHVITSLTPLFELAAKASRPKFINLDMEEYKDLELTMAVFRGILDQPQLKNLEAGIVLQAYLPDALSAMMRLQAWAAERRAQGGAGIKVRIVKGANLPMEHVESSLHDWPLATLASKQATDTNYKRVISYALHPDRIDNVRIGVAGHNLFDLAFAWLLAERRGVNRGIEFEMLLGMASGQAEAVRRDVGGLLLYTPVVHPAEFDVAIAYLIRRLEEGASTDNFMSAVFELTSDDELFEREKQRFLASVEALDSAVPAANRTQNRQHPAVPADTSAFHNAVDTDPALPANQAWGRAIIGRVTSSELGAAAVEAVTIATVAELDAVIEDARQHAAAWGSLSGAERGAVLHRAADTLEQHRAELLEVMAAETGKTLDQSDPEVSEAIDFAHYYAERAAELDAVAGATFVPARLTVVTPPWNFPVAIPAGGVTAALAAGSAVIIKPAPQAARSGAVMVETLWEAGVPREVLKMVQFEESSLGAELLSNSRVDRVILTGGFETAELFRSFRPDLPLLAETSGKNAIIVTPSADLDLAARDVVSSAFGHAGQKCSAASLVILVGSVATSARFNNQLADAVRALKVGYPSDATTQMGPIIEPASGKLLRALTTLAPGESWVVEPRQLDGSGRLWSPGVRSGVKRGSEFHLTECFGPVLGIMTAQTLEEAIVLQNQVDYGLTAGLHSLEPAEISTWIDTVEAGNLYVNRGTTGAVVRRQPFGGWKKSAVGPGTKAGGPNYLVGLGNWVAEATGSDADFLTRSRASDARAWAGEFGVARDISGLSAEQNVFRYRPVPVTIRLNGGESPEKLARVLSAAVTAGSGVTVSAAESGVLHDAVAMLTAQEARAVTSAVANAVTESDAEWLDRASTLPAGRIRLIASDPEAGAVFARASNGRVDVAVYSNEVTESGRLELLPFLREQAISVTAHRFGSPTDLWHR